MPAGIVGNERMRHAVRAELEGGKRGTLIARPRLVHPHMNGDALVMGAVDRRERRAPIDASEPACIAMGEDIDPLAPLLLGMRANDPEPMLADPAAGLHVLVADLGGASVGSGKALLARQVAHGVSHLVERPTEIDGGGSRRGQGLAGAVEGLV